MLVQILTLLLVLIVMPAQAATWYVTQAGAGATDGTSYANAFAGWSDINMAGISAGDTLIVCGVVSRATTMSFTRAGTSTSPITITGICPEEGGQTGILDGLTTAPITLKLSEAGQDASYVNVEDLTIRNSLWAAGANYCVLVSSLGGGAGGNTFSRVSLHTCGAAGIEFQKSNGTLQYSTITNIYDDAVGFSSAGVGTTIQYNTISNFSVATTTGDAIACNETIAGGATIRGNTITFSNLNSTKQGIICGNNSTTPVVIEYNTVTAPVRTSANHGISFTTGSGVIRGNIVTGFQACVATFTGTITTISIYGNVCYNSDYVAILSTTLGTPTVHFYNNSGVNVTNGFRSTATGPIIRHYNNLYSLAAGSTGDALYIGASNTSYTGNVNVFSPEGATFIEEYKCGSTYSTLAAYKAACTNDQASLATNPLPISTSNGNLMTTSPARRTGVGTAFCLDVRGRVCPPDRPNIGAYQSTSGDPAAPRAVRN